MHLNKRYPGKKHHFVTKVNHYNLHLPIRGRGVGTHGIKWLVNVGQKNSLKAQKLGAKRGDGIDQMKTQWMWCKSSW
jgi:hypothetical protein